MVEQKLVPVGIAGFPAMAIGLLGQVAVPAILAAWIGVELRIAAAIDVFPARISAEVRTAAGTWCEQFETADSLSKKAG